MWWGTRRSICYCSNSARGRMHFRWARLLFPRLGRRPARDGEEEPPAGPLDTMFPSSGTRWDLAWGRGHARGDHYWPNVSPKYRALVGTSQMGKGLCRGSDPSLGRHGGRWDAPTGIFHGTAQPPSPSLPAGSTPVGMLVPVLAPGMQHRAPAAHPVGGRGADGAPAPHLQLADGKSGLAGGPGAAAWTRPAGLRAASVST